MSKERQEIDPVMIQLSEIFINVIGRQLTSTAFCIDLAKSALGWELAGEPEKARRVIKAAITRK